MMLQASRKWIQPVLALSTLLLSLQPLPVLAQGLTAQEIIQHVVNPPKGNGFNGTRHLKVFRLNVKPLEATAKIEYRDPDNYNIEITAPFDIRGIQFNMHNGVNSAYFPDEKLYLYNGGQNTSYMPERIILGSFSKRLDLLKQNYDIHLLKDDFVALNPAYVLEFVPRNTFTANGKEYWITPRRKYWIDKENFHVLQEERFWTPTPTDGQPDNQAYSVALYETFKKSDTPVKVPELPPPAGTNQVNLSGQKKNSFLTYSTVTEAEAKEKIKINIPSYVPKGFALKDIQVFTLFGARIQVLNYTDGLNDLMLTIRPKQNAFVTLLAGAFSLNLIKKITDLSHQAPNNYYSTASDNRIAVAFGDVNPSELQKVASSLSL